MKRFFTIVIEFPALDSFVAALNRWLDSVEDQQQIDNLTARIKSLSSKLKTSIGAK